MDREFYKRMRHLIISLIGVTSIGCANPVTKPNLLVEGKWIVELRNADVGVVRTILEFRSDSNTFIAYTRKNADRDILGFWTSSLGRVFTNTFDEGRLLHIVNGKIKMQGDSALLSGVFTSALGNYYFNGSLKGVTMQASLTRKNKSVYGTIAGEKKVIETPLEDYPAIFRSATAATRENIFNAAILEGSEWEQFESSMHNVSSKVQDDLEMVFAFFYYSRKLPFTHFALMKMDEKEEDEAKPAISITLGERDSQTAYMKITSFTGTASAVDSIFDIVNAKGYKNLVVDLRDNPGGTIESGMQFARNVTDTPFYGGVFLTQKWFRAHKEIPALSQYNMFPHFTESSFSLIINGIHNQEALCLQVLPRAQVFRGKIFILVNGGTASTCEPIVYGLKQHKRATIVGETTAGAMLNGEFFNVPGGFKVVIPTADYYASDGYRIDKGVSPDIVVKPDSVLDFVYNTLIAN